MLIQFISIAPCIPSLLNVLHLGDPPFSAGAKVLDSELWLLWLIAKEEVVVPFDPAHRSSGLDSSVVKDNTVVGETELGAAARHVCRERRVCLRCEPDLCGVVEVYTTDSNLDKRSSLLSAQCV